MTRLIPILIALFALGTQAADKVTLKVATLAPEQSLWVQTFRKAAADAEKRTEGRVKFRLYPGGVHGDEQTVHRKIRSGQLHGGGFVGTGISAICPDIEALQAPMQFTDAKEVDVALTAMDPYLRTQSEENDYVILSWLHLGFTHIFSQKPVESLTALRATKTWMIPDDKMTKEFFSQANISGIATPISDVLTGLQSGLLETVASPPVAMVSLQWFTQVNYHTDMPLLYSLGGFAIHKNAWKKISPADQAIVHKSLSRYFKALVPLIRRQNANAIKAMTKRGIKTVNLPSAARTELSAVCANVRKSMEGKSFSPEAARKLETILKAHRAKQ